MALHYDWFGTMAPSSHSPMGTLFYSIALLDLLSYQMEQCTELKIKFDAIEIRDCYISQHQNDNQLIYISSASSHLFQEQERAPKPWLDATWHLKDNIQVHCKHIQHLHLHVTCTGQQGTTLKVPPVSASKCDRENPEEWSLTNHHLLGKLCDMGRELFWI